jgi:hypothetical protein
MYSELTKGGGYGLLEKRYDYWEDEFEKEEKRKRIFEREREIKKKNKNE